MMSIYIYNSIIWYNVEYGITVNHETRGFTDVTRVTVTILLDIMYCNLGQMPSGWEYVNEFYIIKFEHNYSL